MSLTKELKLIKMNKALERCFKEPYFDVTPITAIHGQFPHRKELFLAHCVDLGSMTDQMVVELTNLAREAIYYERPWWKLF